MIVLLKPSIRITPIPIMGVKPLSRVAELLQEGRLTTRRNLVRFIGSRSPVAELPLSAPLLQVASLNLQPTFVVAIASSTRCLKCSLVLNAYENCQTDER